MSRVLNAFRHHWNLHHVPRRTSLYVTLVLNAFRHHWNLHKKLLISANEELSGAQRLSASLESSLRIARLSQFPLVVLNAFRHHWNLHSPSNVHGPGVCLCSTPFGIIGIFTVFIIPALPVRIRCSTPFGIIGIFTPRWSNACRVVEGAQRLSASLESSPLMSPLNMSPLVKSAQRLSASLESSRQTLDRVSNLPFRCSTPFGIIGIFTSG